MKRPTKEHWIVRCETLLSLLSFVRWDRFTETSVFGWIDRQDGRADFVALVNAKEGICSVTSSAERSAEIGRLLYQWHGAKWSADNHRPCRRVEDALPELVNVVKLAAPRDGEGEAVSMKPCACDCCRENAARFTMDDVPREAGFFGHPPPPAAPPRCSVCRGLGTVGGGKWRRASPCPECSPLSPEVFRRIRAERDQLRAALVGMMGTDCPEGLRFVIGAIESVDDGDARAAVAAARVLLEVRP